MWVGLSWIFNDLFDMEKLGDGDVQHVGETLMKCNNDIDYGHWLMVVLYMWVGP
jgi:hypothetical protein